MQDMFIDPLASYTTSCDYTQEIVPGSIQVSYSKTEESQIVIVK